MAYYLLANVLYPPTLHRRSVRLEDGRIFSALPPAQHPTVILNSHAAGVSMVGSTQSFLTSAGRFVDRTEAYAVADAAGQLLPVNQGAGRTSGTLYSEDLI